VFNLQGSEIVIILLLALVVLGPEKLPQAMRRAGQFYAELRKMSSSFQDEFKAAMEEPVREVRQTADLLRESADLRQLQDGTRPAKPHSAQMIAPAGEPGEPTADVPFGDDPGPAGGEPPAEAPSDPGHPAGDGESTG
jgi:sec-independent protein translocase protein TatB